MKDRKSKRRSKRRRRRMNFLSFFEKIVYGKKEFSFNNNKRDSKGIWKGFGKYILMIFLAPRCYTFSTHMFCVCVQVGVHCFWCSLFIAHSSITHMSWKGFTIAICNTNEWKVFPIFLAISLQKRGLNLERNGKERSFSELTRRNNIKYIHLISFY